MNELRVAPQQLLDSYRDLYAETLRALALNAEHARRLSEMNGTSELMQSELLFRGVLESQLGELQTMVRQLEFAEKNQAEAQ